MRADLDDDLRLDVPVATILSYGGPINDTIRQQLARKGWLPCDGTPLNAKEWPDLFTAIDKFWGTGDGTANGFNLPDTAGQFLRGVTADINKADLTGRLNLGIGATTEMGSVQGYATARPVVFEFVIGGDGSHNHSIGGDITDRSDFKFPAARTALNDQVSLNVKGDGSHKHFIHDGGDHETRPKNIYVNYIIKAGHHVLLAP